MSVDLTELTTLSGEPLPSERLAGKVVLFVNVASRCGLTPQYTGLQALYESKREAGLEIVGVPCNQFGRQEPGTAEQIQAFCSVNYGVGFPLLEKQDVNGPGRSSLYDALVGDGPDIPWNFGKFLVSREAEVIRRFEPNVEPDDPRLLQAIDEALVGD